MEEGCIDFPLQCKFAGLLECNPLTSKVIIACLWTRLKGATVEDVIASLGQDTLLIILNLHGGLHHGNIIDAGSSET